MKYFHSLFVMFTLLAALTACGPGKDRVRIKGKLANITTAGILCVQRRRLVRWGRHHPH